MRLPGAERPSEALRSAIERTFEATAGSAASTRDRAVDLLDEVANRVFQGRENPAIAIARGRLRTNVEDAGAALRFFPAAKPLFSRYRELVSQKYPHLSVE